MYDVIIIGAGPAGITAGLYTQRGNLKTLISMDLKHHTEGIYSQNELISEGKKLVENGNKSFIDATIDNEKMSIMLFKRKKTGL